MKEENDVYFLGSERKTPHRKKNNIHISFCGYIAIHSISWKMASVTR